MTIKEFLGRCSANDYVGFYNVDSDALKKRKSSKRFEKFPTTQTYMKIGNIPYGRIRNYLDKDIMCIDHTSKGYLVRFHDRERLQKSLDNYDLARKIVEEIRRAKND
jgi:hypothetical protein